MKDYGTATSSTTPVLQICDNNTAPLSQTDLPSTIPARKSSESVNPMNVEEHASPSMTPAAAPLAELDHKKSTESMVIDDEIAYSPAADNDHFKLIILLTTTMSLHLKFLALI